MSDDELRALAQQMDRASGLMVATFDIENDPYHPVQTVRVSTAHQDGQMRIIVWLQPDMPLQSGERGWKPMNILNKESDDV